MKCCLTLFLWLLAAPATASASGIMPISDFFTRETWLWASIATVLILLLESVLLRWRVRSVGWAGTFWRVLVLNLASSIGGYIVLSALYRHPLLDITILPLVSILFVVTLIVEIPILYGLYKKHVTSLNRLFLLGLGINIASYGMLLFLQLGLLILDLSYAHHLNKRDLARGYTPALLQKASGVIYSCRPALSYYDFQHHRWVEIPNAPRMSTNAWDIMGNTCAYQDGEEYGSKSLFITTFPEFTVLHGLNPRALAKQEYDLWLGIRNIAISPDETKVALLFPVSVVVAPKDAKGYYDLGLKGFILVLDRNSGEEIARISRWALDDDLCWMSDSRRILFYSLDDTSLYERDETEVFQGGITYEIGYGSDSVFEAGLYSFDILTGDIERFSDGYAPSLASETGHILLRDADELLLLEPDGNLSRRLQVSNLGYQQSIVSPKADFILAGIKKRGYYLNDFMTLIDVNAPHTRHIIDDGTDMAQDSLRPSFRWVHEP